MRNRLQYLYSIFIFSGVFITAYFMIEQSSFSARPITSQTSVNYRSEANLSNTGLDQLFQLENQVKEIGEAENNRQHRTLTESPRDRAKNPRLRR
ncbi:MAG: hypothetical protein EBQ85_06485 [Proteobacteria bacterium]|nr:hypothetical protein [Pseudomonadota bacterium]